MALYAKKRGETAEVCFLAAAVQRGLTVSKPYGDTAKYDFIVERSTGALVKVQVKSSSYKRGNLYQVCVSTGIRGRQPYRRGQIDFVACYILPEELWYIIPARAFLPRRSISLLPRASPARNRWSRFRNAWRLLEGNLPNRKARPPLPGRRAVGGPAVTREHH